MPRLPALHAHVRSKSPFQHPSGRSEVCQQSAFTTEQYQFFYCREPNVSVPTTRTSPVTPLSPPTPISRTWHLVQSCSKSEWKKACRYFPWAISERDGVARPPRRHRASCGFPQRQKSASHPDSTPYALQLLAFGQGQMDFRVDATLAARLVSAGDEDVSVAHGGVCG